MRFIVQIYDELIFIILPHTDPNQSNGKIGSRVDKNLSVLEILDGYNFDRIDSSNDCLDTLYNRLLGLLSIYIIM